MQIDLRCSESEMTEPSSAFIRIQLIHCTSMRIDLGPVSGLIPVSAYEVQTSWWGGSLQKSCMQLNAVSYFYQFQNSRRRHSEAPAYCLSGQVSPTGSVDCPVWRRTPSWCGDSPRMPGYVLSRLVYGILEKTLPPNIPCSTGWQRAYAQSQKREALRSPSRTTGHKFHQSCKEKFSSLVVLRPDRLE